MASGNIFKLLAEIKALKLDYAGAVKYLTDQGIEVVGIIKQGLDNFFKKIKARDPDFGNVVQKLPIDDTGVPFHPNTLKSTAEKRGFIRKAPEVEDTAFIKEGTGEADRDIAFIQKGIDDLNKAEREADLVSKTEGIENLFDEKLPKVKMGSRMNYEKIAELEDIDVELIRGKTWSEIRAIIAAIRDKADGGRVGLQSGGWHPGVGRDERGYKSDHPSFEGGDGGDNQGIKTIPVKNISIGVNEFNNLIKPGLTNYRKKYTDILKKYSTDEFSKWQNLDPSLITEEEGQILEPYGTSIWSDMAKEDPAKFFELYRGKQTDSPGVPPRDWQDPDVDRAPLYNWVKDGGRVGFQAGGWADDLTGQGLAVYNSMKSAQHTDQTIQDTLKSLGYWGGDAAGTGVQSIVNTQPAIGGGGDGNINSYEFSTPKFNQQGLAALKEYGPGGTYEMNPAALGMSFFEQSPKSVETYGQGIDMNKARSFEENKALIEQAGGIDKIGKPIEKNFLGKTWDAFTSAPNKMTSQFEIRPGVVPKGPQELGFMTKDIEGFPGVNRDDIRAMYDNYGQFLGRGSAYKDARVKGKVGNLIDMIPYMGTIKRGAQAIFGAPGDKSDRARWAVDNAGYGQGTGRDQFGTYTGGKTLMGKTADYQERMEDKIGHVAETFGKKYGFTKQDLMNLDADALETLSSKNNFYATMIKDYVQKIGITKQNKIIQDQRKDRKEKELKILKEKQKIDAAATFQQKLDQAYQQYGGQDSPAGGGGRYDGASSKAEWSKDPTAYSGSFKDGGLATMFTRRR